MAVADYAVLGTVHHLHNGVEILPAVFVGSEMVVAAAVACSGFAVGLGLVSVVAVDLDLVSVPAVVCFAGPGLVSVVVVVYYGSAAESGTDFVAVPAYCNFAKVLALVSVAAVGPGEIGSCSVLDPCWSSGVVVEADGASLVVGLMAAASAVE
jgi:hypothetical protein